MTTDVAAIGLVYDDEDLQLADLSIFLQITQGLNEPAEPRGIDVLVPALDGQIARPRRPHQLRLVLTGHIMGNGVDQDAARASFRTSSKFLRTLFDPARDPATLVATLEDGTVGSIDARPLNSIFAERVLSEFADVSIELLSVTPDWTFETPGS